MRLWMATVCVILAAAALGQAPATQPAAPVSPTVAPTSQPSTQATGTINVDRQLRLKRKLLMGHDSLIAVLESNRQNWDRYSPEQRQVLRQRAYAFRQADSAQQEQVLDAWGRFMTLSDSQKERYRERATWLTAVISELPAETRSELIKLPSAERARRLLELKKQMEEQGKLPAASQPATKPATE